MILVPQLRDVSRAEGRVKAQVQTLRSVVAHAYEVPDGYWQRVDDVLARTSWNQHGIGGFYLRLQKSLR